MIPKDSNFEFATDFQYPEAKKTVKITVRHLIWLAGGCGWNYVAQILLSD